MKPLLKKIIIVVVILIAIIVAYRYFFASPSNPSGTSLSSSNMVGVMSNTGAVPSPEDTAFLSTLLGLTDIKVDTTLFSSTSFNSLQDNFVPIINDGIFGRPNPFAPIDAPKIVAPVEVAPVTTLNATQITNNSALLSGSLTPNVQAGAKSFQWGKSETLLDKEVVVVGESLVGTFSKTLTGLSPKTTYYFRAKATIGVIPSTGNIISFTTN